MIRVKTFGQTAIEVGRTIVRPDAQVAFAALLYLTTERGRLIERDILADLLWPRENAARRRHSLRQVLYKLRQLGVPTDSPANTLSLPRSCVWLDFEDIAAEADGGFQELAGPRTFRCLPGYIPKQSRAFARWIDELRVRAEAAARRQLVTAIAHARQDARWDAVDSLARSCLQIDPLNEEATLALAEAIALSGSKAEAIAMLDKFAGELGTDVRNICLPARVLRARIADHLVPRRDRHSLEVKLVGRESMIQELNASLEAARRGTACMHALLGPSGIGKTRVAEEVARLAAILGFGTVVQRAAPDDAQTPGLTLGKL